ncbi:MAG: CBS domain-containing protein [Dehalococcoidales bacterium]|nr:CBS domain-containing protein [Dehalococcoidales bacterium]
MIVSDVMSTNVISIPSHTTLAEARRVMDSHHFRRLPVIDRGKLVGIVTKDALDRTGPSQLTTFSIHELTYLLERITVQEAMHRDVVTVSPDMTVEEAVALAQIKKVGALLVTEGDRVLGIATTNDFFYKVLNPILGIGIPGSRIVVRDCFRGPDIEKVLAAINELGISVDNLFIIDLPQVKKHDLVVHLQTENTDQAIGEIRKLGYTVEERAR